MVVLFTGTYWAAEERAVAPGRPGHRCPHTVRKREESSRETAGKPENAPGDSAVFRCLPEPRVTCENAPTSSGRSASVPRERRAPRSRAALQPPPQTMHPLVSPVWVPERLSTGRSAVRSPWTA